MKLRLSLVILLLFLSLQSVNAQVDVDIELVEFATDLNSPVDLTHAGDERLFYVDQDGVISIIQPNGSVNPVPFLNIQSLTSQSGERGLLGLAFHPDYQENGYFFINYTRNNGNTRIARYSVSSDPDVADPGSALEIMSINQPYSNHNGGCIKFGPDGYLYIGMGDGGAGEDPDDYGQSMDERLGKFLRIDIDAGSPYAIPADNPFVDANPSDTLPEIWSSGIRNPWKFSFDSQTGDLWIGDVGQYNWEEVDYEPVGFAGGANYGWRCYEGNHSGFGSNCPPLSDFTGPVTEYNHNGGRCSITGGFVYRGTEFPSLNGKYFFTDYCNGQFWSLEQNDADEWVRFDVLGSQGFGWTGFGEDVNGNLYVLNSGQGKAYKIIQDCSDTEASFEFDLESTLIANGGVAYQWYLNGDIIDGATDQEYEVTENGSYSVFISFSNGCSAISGEQSVVISSLVENRFNPTLIGRNPISNELILNVGNDLSGLVMIKVFNIQGRLVYESNAEFNEGLQIRLNASDWAKGKYILDLTGDKSNNQIDFIKD